MLKLLADENFDGRIYRGLVRQIPNLDIVRAQDFEHLYGADDPTILEWAAAEGRILVTHDVATMAGYAYDRVKAGLRMPGVFEVHFDMAIGQAVEELSLLILASDPEEWEGQVRFLPL